jgi:hypothetical protein
MSDTCSVGHARSYSFPWRCSFFLLGTLLFPSLVHGNTDYYRHTYFDNSLTSDFYFYSSGQASAPSSLEQSNDSTSLRKMLGWIAVNALAVSRTFVRLLGESLHRSTLS